MKKPPAKTKKAAKPLNHLTLAEVDEDLANLYRQWASSVDLLKRIEQRLPPVELLERAGRIASFAEDLLPRLGRRIKDLVLVSSSMAELCNQHNDLALDIEKMEGRVIETHVILQGLLRILIVSKVISRVDYEQVNSALEGVEFPRSVRQRPRVKFQKPEEE